MVFGFGKKKKEKDLTGELKLGNEELGIPELNPHQEAPGFESSAGVGMPEFAQEREVQHERQAQQPYPQEREYEVLSAKLDALKAILDSINQRLENIERIAKGDHEKYY